MPEVLPFTGRLSFPVKPVPLAVHTRVSEVALVVLQVSVNDCPAVIVDGVRCTLTVGAGEAAADVVRVRLKVVVPPAPVAVQVQVEG